MKLNVGDKVKMNSLCKSELIIDSADHVDEFGNCEGIIVRKTYFETNTTHFGGFYYDVRWLPNNLTYLYPEQYLTNIKELRKKKLDEIQSR